MKRGSVAATLKKEHGRPARDESMMEEGKVISRDSNAPLSAPFFNPYEEVNEHWHNLPHWQQDEVWQFVTWRLGDSLPKSKLDEWYAGKQVWLKSHPHPWDEATARAYHAHSSARIDAWLDAGHGSCVLKDPRCAAIVADALRYFAGKRYALDAFVVMPNHVHVLFRPIPYFELEDILHSWKSFTAKAINKLVQRNGPLWQEDYWDRMIRNEAHFHACKRYIVENPFNAKLPPAAYILAQGSTGVPPVIG